MASRLSRVLLWRVQAAMFWLLWRSALLPVDSASAFGAWLFGIVGPRLPSARKIARNMRVAFPNKTPTEIAALVHGAWRNFGRVMAEIPYAGRLGQDRVEVVGEEHLLAVRASGKPCILFSAHVGNWELAAIPHARLGMPLAVVYSPIKNPIIDRMLLRLRGDRGCRLIPNRVAGVRDLLHALRRGESLGLIVDRSRRDGALALFFGREAWTTTGPARLALKFGCPLIPIRIERVASARFRAIVYPPLQPPPGDLDDQILDLTRQMNGAIEFWVKDRPEQWWCDTNRWKRAKPMPPSESPDSTAL